MNITRRGFLQALAGLGAAAVAPAIVRAENIMRVRTILTPTLEECWVYGAQMENQNWGPTDRMIFSAYIKKKGDDTWTRQSVCVPHGAQVGITPGGTIVTTEGDPHWTAIGGIHGDTSHMDGSAVKIIGHKDAAIYPAPDGRAVIEPAGHDFTLLRPSKLVLTNKPTMIQ